MLFRSQYAKAMGLQVAAVDVDEAKLDLAKRLGATVTVNAKTTDPVAYLKKEIGGAHGALVTAVSPKAFEQAIGMVRRSGTVSLNGLPPGEFPLDIFGMVLNGITVRGSIVGTRRDLQESLDFRREAQGARDRHHRQAGEHQRRVRAHAQGADRRPCGAGFGRLKGAVAASRRGLRADLMLRRRARGVRRQRPARLFGQAALLAIDGAIEPMLPRGKSPMGGRHGSSARNAVAAAVRFTVGDISAVVCVMAWCMHQRGSRHISARLIKRTGCGSVSAERAAPLTAASSRPSRGTCIGEPIAASRQNTRSW